MHLEEEPIDYYRGSKPIVYKIADESEYASVVTQMISNSGGFTQIIDQRGDITSSAAFSFNEGGKIGFKSNVIR